MPGGDATWPCRSSLLGRHDASGQRWQAAPAWRARQAAEARTQQARNVARLPLQLLLALGLRPRLQEMAACREARPTHSTWAPAPSGTHGTALQQACLCWASPPLGCCRNGCRSRRWLHPQPGQPRACPLPTQLASRRLVSGQDVVGRRWRRRRRQWTWASGGAREIALQTIGEFDHQATRSRCCEVPPSGRSVCGPPGVQSAAPRCPPHHRRHRPHRTRFAALQPGLGAWSRGEPALPARISLPSGRRSKTLLATRILRIATHPAACWGSRYEPYTCCAALFRLLGALLIAVGHARLLLDISVGICICPRAFGTQFCCRLQACRSAKGRLPGL